MDISFSELGAFSALFQAYCKSDARLAPFFSDDFQQPEARGRIADLVAAHPHDRKVLVDVLLEQNTAWSAEGVLDDATCANIEALLDPKSLAVVTGQQVGIFTGALYTPLKTITAIQLARQMSEETGRKVVPVFWLEGEDHDLAEMSYLNLPKGNETETLSYTGHSLPPSGNLGAVGRLAFTAQIEEVVAQIDALLPPTDFKPVLMAHLHRIYSGGKTFLGAFAQLMRTLFPHDGLVFISPDDRRLKTLVKPLFKHEIEHWQDSEAKLKAVSESLKEAFHAQVNARALNMALLTDEGRYGIEAVEGGFRLRGTDKTYSQEALLALLESEPERFSPNVVLRPIVQDALLPTVAYIAGPSEVAYFAQFKPIYEALNVQMPLIYPRVSATVVEGRIAKIMQRYNLTLGDLSGDFEALFRRLVLAQSDKELELAYQNALQSVHSAVNQLKLLATKVDQSLERSAEATRASLMNELDKFNKKLIQAEKRNHEQMRDQLWRAKAALFPNNGLQERTISVLYFLNKYGLDLMQQWTKTLPLDTTAHQIIEA
jgi:bacillithiol biosynthesis cysteine-adding enzyme BshC